MPRSGDLGIDLRSSEDVIIKANTAALVPTGVQIEMPEGYALLIKDRSSESKYGHVLAGVIDNSYRGELFVRIYCHTPSDPGVYSVQRPAKGFEDFIGTPPMTRETRTNPVLYIKAGQKIAQAIIVPDLTAQFYIKQVTQLTKTERGEGGFGSTGK